MKFRVDWALMLLGSMINLPASYYKDNLFINILAASGVILGAVDYRLYVIIGFFDLRNVFPFPESFDPLRFLMRLPCRQSLSSLWRHPWYPLLPISPHYSRHSSLGLN